MLRTLVAVSETGSITAAADRVGRSPGAVSATVQQFEEELGIQVFVRKPAKGMAVTSYGKLLVLEAKGLLAHADEFRSIAGAWAVRCTAISRWVASPTWHRCCSPA